MKEALLVPGAAADPGPEAGATAVQQQGQAGGQVSGGSHDPHRVKRKARGWAPFMIVLLLFPIAIPLVCALLCYMHSVAK